MLYTSWSIALLVCSAAVLFLCSVATVTAIRVLLYWDASADTARQIALERQTWLVSLLMHNAMVLQIGSFLVLIFAAESFAKVLAGAMCATGTFWANGYGPWLLGVRCVAVFFSAFWLLLHYFDNTSELQPLLRAKFRFLLILFPLLLVDSVLLVLFLGNLEPDIITSCCGVIFGDGVQTSGFTSLFITPSATAVAFYVMATAILMLTVVLLRGAGRQLLLAGVYSFFWLLFFLLSLVAITMFFSPYIYATPAHRCPFDILQSHYNYIGLPVYCALFCGAFSGMSVWPSAIYSRLNSLSRPASRYRRKALAVSLFFLLFFVFIVTWFPLIYVLGGGER